MVLAIVLIADVALAMVLIEDVLTLLLMVLICARDVLGFQVLLLLLKATHQDGTPPAPVVSSNTVAAERGPAANNGNHEIDQQATRPA